MEPTAIVSKVRISKLKAEQFLHDNKTQFVDEIVRILNGEYVRGNVLILQYEKEIESMVFIYWLELRDPDSMKQMPGLQAFKRIANYKDIETSDLMVFSSSAPNFLTDPIWLAYKIGVNEVSRILPKNLSEKSMSELNEILGKYIFDTARENNDSIDASNNPYSLFFNNKCIHPILVEQYNVRAGG
jgi:hypothetical protein